jgi:hypothetical protein
MDDGVWSIFGMIRCGKTEVYREMPVPVPFCPPHITHGRVWFLESVSKQRIQPSECL